MTPRILWAALALFVLLTRLCHLGILWIEEAYPSAAAIEVLLGKTLYRDIWFDKPPLYALIYCLWGANTGMPLRLAGTMYILLCAYAAYAAARRLWGQNEANWAAALLCFYLTFGIPSAVMPLAPDLLTIPFHILAVLFALEQRPLISGLTAGVACAFNAKAVFIAVACCVLHPRGSALIALGLVIAQIPSFLWLYATGALQPYLMQVWSWGLRYSADSYLANAAVEGFRRTAAWAGFHATAVIATILELRRSRSWRYLLWCVVSLVAVAAGFRFFPRYYFHLLPAVILLGARGLVVAPKHLRLVLLLLLLIPAARFGPRFATLASDLVNQRQTEWADLALMNDSVNVAKLINERKRAGDTILVWGYRSDIAVFSGLTAGTPFLDSQPLTGVLADRHLTVATATFPELARSNRSSLHKMRPTFVVDALGPMNAPLAVSAYPDLASWIAQYDIVARTPLSVVYRLRSPDRTPLPEKR